MRKALRHRVMYRDREGGVSYGDIDSNQRLGLARSCMAVYRSRKGTIIAL
jgi:hypothetical protein